MTNINTIVDGYIAAWNERDAESRRAIVAEAFADDATYVDPLMTGEGTDGISAMIGGAQQQFPGHRFELSAGPDAHHDRVRFAWTLLGADNGTPVAAGVDFATVADDGRLRAVTGFLEPVEAS
jgi:SnoaL-like domain